MSCVLGITGGSGSGKTLVSNILREHGIEIIDGDKVARMIMEPGQKCLEETIGFFGENLLDTQGRLKRKELSDIVFSDKAKLNKLNEITHKYIKEYFIKKVRQSKSDIIGFDGAALFESGMDKLCSYVLGVLADTDIRIERIIKRDGILKEAAQKRIASQKNNEFYIENCDFLVYNNDEEENVRKQIKEVLLKLEQEEEKRKRAD